MQNKEDLLCMSITPMEVLYGQTLVSFRVTRLLPLQSGEEEQPSFMENEEKSNLHGKISYL